MQISSIHACLFVRRTNRALEQHCPSRLPTIPSAWSCICRSAFHLNPNSNPHLSWCTTTYDSPITTHYCTNTHCYIYLPSPPPLSYSSRVSGCKLNPTIFWIHEHGSDRQGTLVVRFSYPFLFPCIFLFFNWTCHYPHNEPNTNPHRNPNPNQTGARATHFRLLQTTQWRRRIVGQKQQIDNSQQQRQICQTREKRSHSDTGDNITHDTSSDMTHFLIWPTL